MREASFLPSRWLFFAAATDEVSLMVILMIDYRLPTDAVRGYAEWKLSSTLTPLAARRAASHVTWNYRDHSDPNHFMLTMEFSTIDEAKGFLN